MSTLKCKMTVYLPPSVRHLIDRERLRRVVAGAERRNCTDSGLIEEAIKAWARRAVR